MDEESWAAYRKRLRETVARQSFLVIGPLMILMAVAILLDPIDHPAGDIRDRMPFRLVGAGAFVAFGVVAVLTSARRLLADRRKGPP